MLNILEGFAPEELRWGTSRGVHLMVEAKKLAVADRLSYLGDPRMVDNPLETLLSDAYAAERRRWKLAGILARQQPHVQLGARHRNVVHATDAIHD